MTTYRISFELTSSVRTAFQADIIWGHLVWAYRYINDESKVINFLDSYDDQPTLISNAFPEGILPMPILKPLSISESEKLAGQNLEKKKNLVAHLDSLKKLKQRDTFPTDALLSVINDFSYLNLYGYLLKKSYSDIINSDSNLERRTDIVSHNTISRLSNTVLKKRGGFFQNDEVFYHTKNDKPVRFWFLVKTEFWSLEVLQIMTEFMAHDGYGADKTTGKGALKNIHIEKDYQLPAAESPNAFMSLSNFVPSPDMGTSGYYEVITKFGKLGAEFARLKNPFKTPVIFMKAGSTFFLNSKQTGIYGCLLDNIHHERSLKEMKIRHYGYSFPIYVRIPNI